jgi:hypothetical protein
MGLVVALTIQSPGHHKGPHRLCPRLQQRKGASFESGPRRYDIIDQQERFSGHICGGARKRPVDIGPTCAAPESNLRGRISSSDQSLFVQDKVKPPTCLASQEQRLIIAPLAYAGRVQRYRHHQARRQCMCAISCCQHCAQWGGQYAHAFVLEGMDGLPERRAIGPYDTHTGKAGDWPRAGMAGSRR